VESRKEWILLRIGEQIRERRLNKKMTQKSLAEKLGVSDKTISSWETGRTLPDVELLLKLGDLLESSFIEKSSIQENLTQEKVKKKVNPYLVWGSAAVVFLLLIGLFFNTYKYQSSFFDRINPFLKTKIGYTVLPITQGPVVKEYWVANDEFGQGMWLSLEHGATDNEKKHAMVKHKGSYVKKVRLISWETVPESYKDLIGECHDEAMERQIGEPVVH
jgi:transcriptional regulator with XRE-family HTH domain